MIKKNVEKGTRQLVWLPNDLFELTENARKKLGISRSAFYRYSIMQLLQQLSVLSTKVKENPRADKE
jgi:ACT domain-containing protein